jgi:hypothetical protein
MLRVVEKPTKENEELRTTLDELLQRGALKGDLGPQIEKRPVR